MHKLAARLLHLCHVATGSAHQHCLLHSLPALQLQRLAVARALCARPLPSLLILDEALGSVPEEEVRAWAYAPFNLRDERVEAACTNTWIGA